MDVEEPENGQGDATSDLVAPLLSKHNGESDSTVDIEKIYKENSMKKLKSTQHDISSPSTVPYSYDDIEEGEVIGIITLEDVFEELLQEEIVDETDEYVDVHKRIRVAAVAVASSIARAPSSRRLKNSSSGGQSRHGQSMKKPSDDDLAATR